MSVNLGTGVVGSPFYIWKGASFLLHHSKLWKYAAAPISISILVLGGSYFLLYYLVRKVLSGLPHEGWISGFLYYAVFIVVAVVLSIIFFFIFTRIVLAVSAPFNELISQKTEELVRGVYSTTPFSVVGLLRDSVRALSHALKILFLYIVLFLATLMLLLIPGLGQVLFTGVSAILSSVVYAYDYLSYPLDRRKLSWSEKKSFFRSHLRAMLGFGFGNLAMASIPLVNIFFVPAAVVGGTLMVLDIENTEPVVEKRPTV